MPFLDLSFSFSCLSFATLHFFHVICFLKKTLPQVDTCGVFEALPHKKPFAFSVAFSPSVSSYTFLVSEATSLNQASTFAFVNSSQPGSSCS